MINAWLPAFIALAAADWLAVWHGWRRVGYLTKPAALILLLIWFGTVGHFQGALLPFGIGFLCSLAGDILLMASYHYFLPGMGAFLLAHMMYILAFNHPQPTLSPVFFVLGLPVLIVWLLILNRLDSAMRDSGAHKRMRIPVAVYSGVVALMLFSALLTLFRPDWQLPAAVLAAAGGFLFFISDTMLAYDRFVRPFPRARFWVRVTYHTGQLGLAVGALQHFLD
ncbi:lysoplasmalogenase [Pelolinea submarina]|uniref:Putative membrane protein YhhN n=1 Tax=Pelolinea submarina TaxID=913107 RepID=A0A347ZQB7_9CHLR|nr:lysoplasmalogenase [Pelolinea submarina]REG06172.1 putative membrane protein YhhN [Pelolinea submarina]BBB47498.1 alkenylglycerophosphocholine hydrolase [Pelolinea submarina]